MSEQPGHEWPGQTMASLSRFGRVILSAATTCRLTARDATGRGATLSDTDVPRTAALNPVRRNEGEARLGQREGVSLLLSMPSETSSPHDTPPCPSLSSAEGAAPQHEISASKTLMPDGSAYCQRYASHPYRAAGEGARCPGRRK